MATTDTRVMTVTTIPVGQSQALADAARQGSASALRLIRAVEYLFTSIERAPKPCLICASAIDAPSGVTVVVALRGADPDHLNEMTGSAVCTACAVAPDIDDRILNAVEDFWHANLVCPVDIHPTAGRA